LLSQRLDRNRFAAPGVGDHRPEALGTLQKKILDIVVIDGLNRRHGPSVAGDDKSCLAASIALAKWFRASKTVIVFIVVPVRRIRRYLPCAAPR
jgi:hypothetical protein